MTILSPTMNQSVVMAAVLLAGMLSGESAAQDSARAEMSRWIQPGSDEENYLRYLQTLGLLQAYPWSARGFSSDELRRLQPNSNADPWTSARSMQRRGRRYGAVQVDIAPAEVRIWYNSAFPFGVNDGAVWVGRGLTTSISAGASAQWGPVALTLAPTAFWAQNGAFLLSPTGDSSLVFANPLYPTYVDRPQRFGNSSYSRLDLGETTLRFDFSPVAAGVSNAHESWGPMTEFPLLLGTNAPGFTHVFFGSSRPVNVFVGRLHGRVIYASLEQSEYSPVRVGNGRRFGAGMVAVFEPRGFPGLELGATRFFHVGWPQGGPNGEYFKHLFESFLKQRVGKVFAPNPADPNSSTDNQLASAFARWSSGTSGLEVYGEYGKEDHNRDPRDIMVEPDHAAAYGLGMRRAWRREGFLAAVRVEIVNFQASALRRHRSEGGFYIHAFTNQGHTNRGQLLGAGFAVGSGSGSSVAFERFHPKGHIRIAWLRLVQDHWNPEIGTNDVQHVLSFERQLFVRRGAIKVHTGADASFGLNRGFEADKANIRGVLAFTWYP